MIKIAISLEPHTTFIIQALIPKLLSQNIQMRSDLVDERHSGYCKAMSQFVEKFNVNYVGGCCGCEPDGIKRFQEIYF